MQIQLSAQVLNQAELLRQIHGLTGPQAAKAYANALNDVAFKVRNAMQEEMRAVFDRPTDYILRSPKFVKATPGNLSVYIAPTNGRADRLPSTGGKSGIDPQRILDAQTWGGRRADKRSEVALKRAGVLPAGYQIVIPSTPYAGTDDGKGNLKGSFLVQLISYLQASSEQGYRANMTDKRKAAVHKGNKRTTGRRYFVALGKLRSGSRTTAKGDFDVRTSHLPPGIWAASGTGGVDVRPVVLFIKAGRYQPRFDMDKVANRADASAYLERRIRFRLREVAGV